MEFSFNGIHLYIGSFFDDGSEVIFHGVAKDAGAFDGIRFFANTFGYSVKAQDSWMEGRGLFMGYDFKFIVRKSSIVFLAKDMLVTRPFSKDELSNGIEYGKNWISLLKEHWAGWEYFCTERGWKSTKA